MARARLAPLVVAVVGVLYFGLTAGRDLQPFDSTEFALNAVQLGVGHPPGQPLYLVLSAGVVRLLGFLAPPHALVWLSIAATVVAAAWALRFALRAVADCEVASEVASEAASEVASEVARRRSLGLVLTAALGAYLLPGVWDMATRAEVYPLAALLIAGAALVAVQHGTLDGGITNRRADTASQHEIAAPQYKWLAAIGLLLGLGASVNPIMAVAGGVALGPGLLAPLVASGARGGIVGALVLIGCGLAGLLPYAVLPLLGAHPREALVWGEPLWRNALAFYLGGRDYRAWHVDGAELAANLGAAVAWLLAEGILPWLVLGTIGFALTSLPRGLKLVLPLGALVATALLGLNHPFVPSNPDYDGYLLPWLWLASAGVALLLLRLPAVVPRGHAYAPLVALSCIAAGATSGARPWHRFHEGWGGRTADRSQPLEHREGRGPGELLARRALEETPAGGVLLLESDHLVFPALYLWLVDGSRPDVLVINVGWTNSAWYLRWLRRHDPSLPEPHLDAPSREARLAALLSEAGRPVAAEHLRLAALAGRPCMSGLFARGGAACELPSASASATTTAGTEEAHGGQAAVGTISRARQLAHAPLDERMVASTAIAAAEDYLRWRGDQATAFALLRAALPERLDLTGLSTEPPRARAPPRRLTPLTEPRALLPPEALLLRIGDVLASVDPQAASEYYRRADLPESAAAIRRLLDAERVPPQGDPPAVDVAPTSD